MRWRAGIVAATLVTTGALPASGQRGPDFSLGAGPVVAAGGEQFTRPTPFVDVAPAFSAALRWHASKAARVGILTQWARFPFEEGAASGVAREGAREFLTVAAAGRWYLTFDATPPYGFFGAAVGLAWERFSSIAVCASAAGTCETVAADTGAWWGGEVGLSVPFVSGLSLEFSALLSGAVMDLRLGSEGPELSDNATWVGLQLALGGVLW